MFDYDMTIGRETTKMSVGVISGSERIHWMRVHEVYFAYIIVKHCKLILLLKTINLSYC